jgi:hypothetical protein
MCVDTIPDGSNLPYQECVERYSAPWLDDLRGGLYIYEKIYRILLCTRGENPRQITANFIDQLMQADSAEQFDATKQSQVDKIQKNSYIDPPVSDNVYENTTNVYYQPYDFLHGF